MDILYLAAGFSVAVWAIKEWHIGFPANVVAVAVITMVVYSLVAQIAGYIISFLTNPPVTIVILAALLAGGAYVLMRRSRGPWKPF